MEEAVSESHTWAGDRDAQPWAQREETLSLFYSWSCPVRRAVSFYHLKDWDRGLGKLMLWVSSLALTWLSEGHDCMTVSLRRVQKSGS